MIRHNIRYFLSILLLWAIGLCSLPRGQAQEISSEGREFFTVFMMNNKNGEGGSYGSTFELSIFVSAKRDCSVNVTNMRTGQAIATSELVRANTIKQIRIPNATSYITDVQANIYDKSLLITATDTISVYSANYASATFDAANVLPTSALGDYYIIQMAEPVFYHSLFSVTAVDPGYTDVDIFPTKLVQGSDGTFYGPHGAATPAVYNGWRLIRPAGTITGDTMMTVRLKQGQSIQVGSYTNRADGDLSGTRVIARAQKKIAVYNGDEVTQIVSPNTAADHIYEQAFPVNTWGKKFVVTNSKSRCNDMVKVTASENNTEVRLDGTLVRTLNAYESYTFWVQSTTPGPARYLETSKPSAVYLYIASLQYCNDVNSQGVKLGDPSMVWIAPLEQKIQRLNFCTFMPMHRLGRDELAPDSHYVNIVTPTSAVSSVRLDGTDISSYFTAVPTNTQYSYARRTISHAVHSIESSGGVIAHVYGIGNYVSYAYNIGSAIRDLTGQIVMNGDTVFPTDTTHYCLGDTIFINRAFDGVYDSVYWKLNNGTNHRNAPSDTLMFIPTRANLGTDSVRMTIYYSTSSGSIHKEFSTRHVFIIHDTTSSTDVHTACSPSSFIWTVTPLSGAPRTREISTSNNTDTIHILNTAGCDSIVRLNLTFYAPSASTADTIVCNDDLPFTWIDGIDYNASTTSPYPTHTITGGNRYGCDSVVTLHLTVRLSNSSTQYDTACDSYTWTVANADGSNQQTAGTYTSSGTHSHIVTNAAGCDSTITLNLTIRDSSRSEQSLAVCDAYTWHGTTYQRSSASGTKRHYMAGGNRWGCDSAAYLNLTIHDSTRSDSTGVYCDEYTWHGTTYQRSSASGTKKYEIHNGNRWGCDSVAYLHLTIKDSSNWVNSQNLCDSYMWRVHDYDGTHERIRNYTQSNHTDTLIVRNALGCDSIIHLLLVIRDSSYSTYTASACDTFTWRIHTLDGSTRVHARSPYTMSNSTDTLHIVNRAGCDSIVHLNLTMYYNSNAVYDTSICDRFFWNDSTYTTSGTYSYNYTTAYGCPSTDILNLTVRYNTNSGSAQVVCDSTRWHDTLYVASGTYLYNYISSSSRCPSVDTLHLTVNYNSNTLFIDTVCDSMTWNRNNAHYTNGGTYYYNYTTPDGCASTDTLRLTVHYNTNAIYTHSACVSYVWNGQTYLASGSYGFQYLTAAGCPSTDTLHLTINPRRDTAYFDTACDEYVWVENNNTRYDHSGTYMRDYVTAQGCPSTDTLHLEVHYNNTGIQRTTACDSFIWAGVVYTVSDTTTQRHFTNMDGCDSLVSLYLTVNYNTNAGTHQTSCDSYTWNGVAYDTTGDYIYRYNAANHCPSADTLHLIVNYSTTGVEVDTVCDTFVWVNGTGLTYTTSNNTDTYTYVNQLGCDSVVTLNLTVNYNSSAADARTVCDSVTWHGTLYTASGDYLYNYQTEANCPSTDTLHLTVNFSGSSAYTMTVCDSMRWHDSLYTTSGDYLYDYSTQEGCSSTDTLHLTVHYNSNALFTQTVCDSVRWNDTLYTISGDYLYRYTNADMCPSTDTLHLTVHYNSNTAYDSTVCDEVLWNGTQYTQSGTYTYNYNTPVDNCPSTDTLHLTVNYNSNTGYTQVACDSYQWHDSVYSQTGVYTYDYTNSDNCPSTDTLHLTMVFNSSATYTETSCDSYTWSVSGETYTVSCDTIYNYTNAVGCPSTDTLLLTIRYSSDSYDTAVVCDSVQWNNTTYNTTGDYFFTFTNGNEVLCDSTAHLHLTVNSSALTSIDTVVCDSIVWINGSYSTSGMYYDTLTTMRGCDSVVVLDLMVNSSTQMQLDRYECDSIVWLSETHSVSGVYVDTLATSHGCDSVVTLNLTISHSTTTTVDTVVCDSIDWFGGAVYRTSMTRVDTAQTIAACDSVVTLNLTVNYSAQTLVDTVVCDSIDWLGSVHGQTGTYYNTLATSLGCDSVVTLQLTVNMSQQTSMALTACDSLPWISTTHTATGTYYDTLSTSRGCDSVVVLSLIVNNSSSKYDTVTACDSYVWNGTAYTTSGDYQQMLTNAVGCDSVDNISLTIHDSVVVVESPLTYCYSYTWNGQTVNTQGYHLLRDVRQTMYGCDSITYLPLTIADSISVTLDVTECYQYTWDGTSYDKNGTYVKRYTSAVSGCDSIVTLHLTINDSTVQIMDSVEVCYGYSWNDWDVAAPGDYYLRHVGQRANGCDSIVYLPLRVNDSSVTHLADVDACYSYIWNGFELNTPGTRNFRQVGTNVHGCDSITWLRVTVHDSSVVTLPDTIGCGIYTWNGQTLDMPGTYRLRDMRTTSYGCDSVTYIQVRFYDTIHTVETIDGCDSYTWIDGVTYTESNYSATHALTDRNGCDSVVTLNLTLHGLPIIRVESEGNECDKGTHKIVALVREDADELLWTSSPYDPSLEGQEHNDTIHVSPSTYTTYRLEGRMSRYGCTNSDEVSISRVPSLHAAIKASPSYATTDNPNIQLTDISTGHIDERAWLMPDGTERTEESFLYHYPLEFDSVTVRLVVFNLESGCTDTATRVIPLGDDRIWAPNVFTPERTTNRKFFIFIKNLRECEIFIYTRQGQLLYRSKDINEGWDGKYHGKVCKQDSYVYRVIYTTNAAPDTPLDKTGTVTLLR